MMSSSKEKKDDDWATKIFRPLLKDLDIAHLTSGNVQILTADYKAFIKYHMDNCVVVVCCHPLTKEHHQGLFIWQYNKEENFYALYIVLNTNLKTDIVARKAVSVHEYVHCVAAMLAFSRLDTKELIDILYSRMSKRFHVLTSIDVDKILKDLNEKDACNPPDLDTFDDPHFRIEWEDFQASYAELYRNLLLSYELFCEDGFFDVARKKEFFQCLLQQKSDEAIGILSKAIGSVALCKRLDKGFVFQRVMRVFLPIILNTRE